MTVYNNWRRNPFTGASYQTPLTEIHTVQFFDDWNSYGIQLTEGIYLENPSSVSIVENLSGGTVFSEVSRTTAPIAGQFRVDYEADTYTGTSRIEFNSADEGVEVLVEYKGLGLILSTENFGIYIPQPGDIRMQGGSLVSSGWLSCDGNSYLRSLYPNLFSAIGTAFGAVDSLHFNVPDLRGRVPMGDGQTTGSPDGNTLRTLGTLLGEEQHELTVAEIASHGHSVSLNDPGHTHVENAASHTLGGAGGGGVPIGTGGPLARYVTDSATTGITVNQSNTGSGDSHNNIQPSTVVRFVIKT